MEAEELSRTDAIPPRRHDIVAATDGKDTGELKERTVARIDHRANARGAAADQAAVDSAGHDRQEVREPIPKNPGRHVFVARLLDGRGWATVQGTRSQRQRCGEHS
jgi:hypothetical protein